MVRLLKRALSSIVLWAVWIMATAAPATAGDIILTNNSGPDSEFFSIEDEPSLVINGFDLGPYAFSFPVALDAVTISVNRATPGVPVDLVIYEDANGGSPVDASLVYHQQIFIDRTGANRIMLNQAAIINEPVIWVGFYLPVGFRFNADQSNFSVLTYWAWTPGGRFNFRDLSAASILGPGDGSEPVNIAMGGVARISAEIREPFFEETEEVMLVGRQFVDESDTDTSILRSYDSCGGLLYDPEDIDISGAGRFSIICEEKHEFETPTSVAQPSGETLDVQFAGQLYKLEAFIDPKDHVEGAIGTLPVAVTHCLRIPTGDLEQAIIAEGRDIPERWYVLPSVRFGDLVCAEITHASYLAYFLPRTDDSPQNVNLVLGWSRVAPHPLQCGLFTFVHVPLVNTGQSWFDTPSSDVKVIVENIHVATGNLTGAVELKVPTSELGPGKRNVLRIGPLIVDSYRHELHRLQVRVDFDDHVEETNEFDNIWFTEYVLANAGGSDRCYDRDWLTATPYPNTVADYCFVGQPYRRRSDGGQVWIPYSTACELDFMNGHVQMPERLEPPRWFTIRDCNLGISVDVIDQNAKVRYRKFSDDCPGEFRHYLNEEHGVMVIDYDG